MKRKRRNKDDYKVRMNQLILSGGWVVVPSGDGYTAVGPSRIMSHRKKFKGRTALFDAVDKAEIENKILMS